MAVASVDPEHCIKCRQQENLTRFNAVHRRIAQALMRYGETVRAMRHAMEAGDDILAGDVLEHVGGVRMQMRQGIAEFMAANRLLDENIMSKRPRLVLSRCLALAIEGRLEEAREGYAAVAAALATGAGEGSEDDFELSVDACIARSGIALHGAERIGSRRVQAILPDLSRLVESPRLDPSTRGNMRYQLASSIIWQGSSMRRSTNSHWHGETLSTTVTRTSSSTWKSVRLPWPRVGWRMRKRTSNEHTGGSDERTWRCDAIVGRQSPAARACAGVQPARTGRCTGQCAETAAGNPDFVLGLCRSEWCGRRPEAPERGRRQCAGGG